jgi:hypothetical protein
MIDEPISPVAEEIEALDRIALTHDGRLLHRYLRRILETVYDTADDGALRVHTGRRTLARDLMSHMARGIEGSSGRYESRGDEPILNRSGSGPTGSRRRAGGRRVDPDPNVARFLVDHGADPA